MRQRWRTIATVCFVAVLFVPVIRPGDGVPLSSYPMYATPRSSEVTFIVAVGLGPGGGRIELSSRTIAGTADPLIVESYLRREVEGGRSDSMCEAIAGRAGGGRIVEIEIRSERFNVVDRVLAETPPVGTKVLASCVVPRR